MRCACCPASVPRRALASRAYEDVALLIGNSQTISQLVVAR
jgi:protein-L-isoaspartate O-methyltransferase